MEVAAVADGLHIHIPLQGHAEDGGVEAGGNRRMALPRWVTERAASHISTHWSYPGRRWPMADDAHGVEAGDQPRQRRGSRGQGGIAHVPPEAFSILGKELRVGGVHQQVLGHGPLYSEDRQALQVDAQQDCPPKGPPSMTCLACSMHQRVCSGVSVSTEHSQPVTPWEAKNRPIAQAGVGGVHVHPAAPWCARSRKPGSTRNPAASTSGRPFSLWCPRLRR